MARTTEAEVKELIDTLLSNEEITPFLTAANVLVTARCDGAYDEEILIQIEKHLTAHFITMRDPRVKSEEIGDAAITYFATSTVGEGLASSPQGQTVQLFDFKGLLSKVQGEADIEAFG